MRDILRKAARFVVSVILLSLALSLMVSLCAELRRVLWFRREPSLLLAGMATFLILHVLWRRKPFLYVFVHELSHALASWLTGGRVHSIYVSGSGGTTRTDRSNTLVLLFPYVFPFLAVTFLSLAALLGWVGDPAPLRPYFYFAMGLALTHHAFFTVSFLIKGQSDLRKVGTLWGVALVAFVNGFIYAAFFAHLLGVFSVQHVVAGALVLFRGLFD